MDQANAVLDRFLERQCLSLAQAREVVDFRPDKATQEIIDELARKANEGMLTEKERAEYEALVEVGDIIAILQAKARDILSEG
jgi:hypothetical protein